MRRPETDRSKAAVLLETSKKDRFRVPVLNQSSSRWTSQISALVSLGFSREIALKTWRTRKSDDRGKVDFPEQKVVTADLWNKMVL